MVPCDPCQGVSALATCSSQARECERIAGVDEEEEEEPKAKRLCGNSLEAAGLDGDSPVAVDAGKEAAAGSDVEETAGVKVRQGTGGVQASAEVAQSTNLKRARNVGWPTEFPFSHVVAVADCCSTLCSICSWLFQWQVEQLRLQGSSRTSNRNCTSCRRGAVCLRKRTRDSEKDMTTELPLKKMIW